MGYIKAQCSNCGAPLEINEEKGRGYCPNCGTLFVAEKVTNNQVYSTTQNITKNIYGREKTEAEEFVANGDVFLSLGEFLKAKNAFDKAIELNPADWKGWFGQVKVKTKNFTDYFDTTHFDDLKKAHSVANDEDDKIIDQLYEQYKDTRNAIQLKMNVEGSSVDNFYEFSRNANQTPTTNGQELCSNNSKKIPFCSSVGYDSKTIKNKNKKHNKKAIAIIIPFIIFMFIIISFVANGNFERVHFFEDRDYIYSVIDNKQIIITDVNLDDNYIVIPSEIDGYTVVEIGQNAFSNNDDVQQVTLPLTINTIDDYAFYYCYSLTEIYINSATPPKLGENVFPKIKSFPFNNNYTIYVPEYHLYNYVSAHDWSNYAPVIKTYNYSNYNEDNNDWN